jgi:hypothetical protein
MVAGVAAMVNQLQLYRTGYRHLQTAAQMIMTWAPPQDKNDTAAYIRNVGLRTGLDMNAKVDINDPTTMEKLVQAITKQEGGSTLDPAVVHEGVARALGGGRPMLPAGGAQPTKTQGGGGGGAVINQSTTVQVAPGPTAGATAAAVAGAQGRVNEKLVRDTAGILR